MTGEEIVLVLIWIVVVMGIMLFATTCVLIITIFIGSLNLFCSSMNKLFNRSMKS
jgi:hypothetical protein